MAKHLFLTGNKGVGKSTLVKQILAGAGYPVSGFFTVKSDKVFADRVSVHLLRAAAADSPSRENMLFFCGVKSDETAKRFHHLGCAALEVEAHIRLLVMDELGPHEEGAFDFCSAVFRALDGNIPILGVLQKAESAFLTRIAEHPDVHLVEVTMANRDSLVAWIEQTGWL